MTLIQPAAEPPGVTCMLTDCYGQDHEFSSTTAGIALIRHVRPRQIASLCDRTGWHHVKGCPCMYHSVVPT